MVSLFFQYGLVRSHQLCGMLAASTRRLLVRMMMLLTPVAAQ